MSAEEVKDLYEERMKHADQVLGNKKIVAAIYEALAKRHPQSRTRGRPGKVRRGMTRPFSASPHGTWIVASAAT